MNPDCPIYLEKEEMEGYMEKIREEVLKRLSPVEVAAIFEDLDEFIYRFKEEEGIRNTQWRLE